METLGLNGSWLTVNRMCNLRCRWCFAEGTKYSTADNLNPELGKQIIKMEKELGINNLIFIGGEPLLYRPLFDLNDFARYCGMKTVLVTNGLMLSDSRIIQNISNSSFEIINVSLKAPNDKRYSELTGKKAFNKVINGIKTVTGMGFRCEVSITLNKTIANDLLAMVKSLSDSGIQSLSIHFCCPSFGADEPDAQYMLHPIDIVKCIMKNFDEMERLMNGNIAIEESSPLCLWPKNFIDRLINNHQISFGCHLLRKQGLIFDPKGYLIPCNALHGCKIGRFGVDFYDVQSFKLFWKRNDIVEFYDKIIAYPLSKCIKCNDYNLCGGGCPLQWFVYKPEEIIRKEVLNNERIFRKTE